MHISSLVLHGFKSFGKKSTIKFGRGITGVVGPNGCGKTNIVDALRWVLGEQRQSVIRAGRMEEIIFNGSRNHKPSSLCEVSVTIHNDKGRLPTEYTDVEITRRLYRDGESEYLINRQPCRLKDITDLFIDTGMGSDAYSVIELKMVEDILSDVGEDRRRMFEEAAGVNKYKKQRSSTFRKLEATRLDLERINDIAGEVTSKVKALGLQLKRFERHHKLTVNLTTKEMTLARIKVHAIAEKQALLIADLKAAKSSRDSEAGEISEQELGLNVSRESLRGVEQEFQAASSLLEAATDELNQHRRQAVIWVEQIKAAEGVLLRIATDRSREEASGKERQISIDALTLQMEKLLPGTQKQRDTLAAKQEQESQFASSFKSAESALDETREKQFRHRQEILEAETRLARSKEHIEEKEAAAAKLEEELRMADELALQLSGQLKKLQARLTATETADTALEKEAGSSTAELDRVRTDYDAAKDAAHAAATEMQLLRAQLAMLEQLADGHEGYPAGTKAILASMDDYEGVLGTVADLAQLPGEHAQAVEAALGAIATALLVRTSAEARALLDKARQNRLGRLAVIPLDKIEAHSNSGPIPAGLTPLIETISVEIDLQPLFDALLSGIYLGAEDGAPADNMLEPGVTIITARGDRYGSVPLWVHSGGGGGDDEASGAATSVVGRTAEIAKLTAQLEKSQVNLQQAEAHQAAIKDNIQKLQVATQERQARAKENQSALAAIKEEISRTIYQQEQGAKGQTASMESLPSLKSDLEKLRESLISQSAAVDNLQKNEQAMQSATGDAQEKFTRAQQQVEKWREEIQELRLILINIEHERANLAERKLSLQDLLQSGAQRLAALTEEKSATEAELKGLKEKVSQADRDEKSFLKKVTESKAAASVTEKTAQAARDAISAKEAELRSRQHLRETFLGDLQSRELTLEQLKQEEALIRSRIKELFGKPVGKLQEGDPDSDAVALQQELDAARRSLEKIGPVNMAVAQEHEEEMERLTFLTDQRDDLMAAAETLLETMQKIDHQARDQFQSTYDQIRHHFKQTFGMFFEGGEGDLRLVGDPDPLESDIEIIAVPPGKKSRNLRSLSAGEKALTAIALLFAIYLVKPSPYCILDEVDAPLDDINIGKFSKVISQFSQETQFIVVTHNKLSMERADYLYGVTMAEEGLSSLVSVDLHQYAA